MESAYHVASRLYATRETGLCDVVQGGNEPCQDSGIIVLSKADFHVRLATPHGGQRSHINMLIERLYTWKGLDADFVREHKCSPNEITLAAYQGNTLFGTLTLGLDSQQGIRADALYRSEIDTFRNQGAKVCELTQFAIDPSFNSKEILASFFHLAYIFFRLIHQKSDLFIEVNPRHVGFYKRTLGFRPVGAERHCERVGAPARLLHLSLSHADTQIAGLAGQIDGSIRNLYSLFYSPDEQSGLLRRLLRETGAAAV